MDLLLFQKYWDKIEPLRPLFDKENARYEDWKVGNLFYHGMRHLESRKPHGICRCIDPSTRKVIESSFINGRRHGLSRELWNGKGIVILH